MKTALLHVVTFVCFFAVTEGVRSQGIRTVPGGTRGSTIPRLPPTTVPTYQTTTTQKTTIPTTTTAPASARSDVTTGGGPPPEVPVFVPVPVPYAYVKDLEDALKGIDKVIRTYNDFRSGSEPTSKLDAWMQAAAKGRPTYVVFSLTGEDALAKLRQVEEATINWVAATVRWQLQQIRPFENDSAATRSAKAAFVQETSQQVSALANQAAHEAASGQDWTRSSDSSIKYTPGNAHKQLVQINTTSIWKNQ